MQDDIHVPTRLVFRHIFIATFDAPIPTCAISVVQEWFLIRLLLCVARFEEVHKIMCQQQWSYLT